MNILIVDDEIQTVRAIKYSIEWSKIGIDNIYTACTISQAKEVFLEYSVDIILCDIEMPHGSGFELIEWIKEHSPQTENIIITCHAEFEYAKKAISLGSFEYIVKPILFADLESTIIKAIAKIRSKISDNQNKEYGKYWIENRPIIEEKFWIDLLTGKINDKQISEIAAKRNIKYMQDEKYSLLLISIKRLTMQLNDWDNATIDYAIKNFAKELIAENLDSKDVISYNGLIVVILSLEQNKSRTLKDLEHSCIQLIFESNKYIGCNISCYLSNYVFGEQLADSFKKLLQIDKNNITGESKIFKSGFEEIQPNSCVQIELPNVNEWVFILSNGDKDSLLKKVNDYLNKLNRSENIDARILVIFHHDLLQMVYSFLESKGIQAHLLFNDENSSELYKKAENSIDDMTIWMNVFINKAMDYLEYTKKSESVVDKIKEYINNNLNKNISREDIANALYFNPDTLTKIFRKETGHKLSEYLIEQRIKKSEILVSCTENQISDIAMEMGYDNISYFCTIFKKVTGYTPVEYRKKYGTGKSKQ